MQNPSLAYRPDIDGLRAIAVLAVLGFHAFPDAVPGGFVGVDIFFVISGYLISSIILAQLGKQSFSLTNFYARRIKRIFPALLFVLISCLGLGWLILLPNEFRELGQHTAAAAVFGSNFWLWHEVDYFDTAAELKPLLHLWSLAIEEQFYVAWPLLLFLFSRQRSTTLLFIVIAGLLSFASCLISMNEQPAMFYFPWNRAWELLIGAALAEYLSRPHAPLKPALASTLSLAGIGLITAAIALIDKDDIFPGWLATIPTLGSALLIAAGTRAWPNRLLGLKPIVVIGLISYPLYLWHWPLLVFARIIEGGEPSAVIRAGALAVSTVLAGLTYVILERPLRTGGRITITALSATIIMVGCVGYSAGKEFLKPRSSLSGLDAVINAYDDWGYDVDGRYLYKKNRFEQIGDAETITAFIGDSNAQQYFPRISTVIDADRANHQRAIYAWTGGCPPIKHVKKRGRRCAERMDAAYNMIMETPDINRVVIAALWRNYFIESQDYYYENNGIRYELNAQETKEGIEKAYVELEHMVEDFRQEGKVVYIILNIPIGPELESRTLISRSWKTLGIALTKSPDGISRASFSEEMAPVTERLTAIAKRTGSTVLDPIPWLCGPERCRPLTEKGWPIYKDRAHITASFAREHLHELDQTIRK